MLFAKASLHSPCVLLQLFLLDQFVDVRGRRGRRRFLIRIFNGFRGTQPCAVVVFYLVSRNSGDPGLQGTSPAILAEALQYSQEDFLDQVLDLVIPRCEARANVAIEVSSPGESHPEAESARGLAPRAAHRFRT